MSKIICDVCGTSYPETSNQCPICGNAKAGSASVGGDSAAQGAAEYAYVKGGRFSHANVRKRNGGKTELPRTVAPARPVRQEPVIQEPAPKPVVQPEPVPVQQPAPAPQPAPVQQPVVQPVMQPAPVVPQNTPKPEPAPAPMPRRREPKKKGGGGAGNVILLIIVFLLVAAIVTVCAYITIRLLDMSAMPEVPTTTTSSSQTSTSTSTSSTPPADVPCTSVRLSMPSYTFSSVGQTLLLEVEKQPKNTTDSVFFESSDPYIASVNTEGKVVAVAKGTVIITVRCGDQSASCEITCRLSNEPDYPTQPPTTTTRPTEPTTQPTAPKFKLELNRTDFTLEGFGATHNLYSGELDPASITWTSSNEEVATVTNGIVKAVGNGKAVITAEYEGQKVTCDVHCTQVVKGGFKLSTSDTTIKAGQSFTLRAYLVDENGDYILDEDGNKIRIDPSELKFYVTDAEGFVSVDENGKVTGLKDNRSHKTKYKYVYVEYNGVVLKCIVRVKEEPTTEEE